MTFYKKQKAIREQMVKDAIFEASVSIILDKGYDNLTMNDVAGRVGIATGTIYNYFTNKEELFLYIYERLHDVVGEKMQLILDKKDSPVKILEEYINTALSFGSEYRIIIDIARQKGIKIKNIEKIEFLVHGIEKIIEKCIELREIRPVNALKTAKLFFLYLVGYIELSIHSENNELLINPIDLIELLRNV